LCGENRDKSDNGAILLSDEHPSVGFGTPGSNALPVAVSHLFARTEPRIDSPFELLELNHATTHGRSIFFTIDPNHEPHEHSFAQLGFAGRG
jgi:hypothetical protein